MSMVNKNADEHKEIKKDERDWASLPICLLEMISSHLYTRDTIRFRLACKPWQCVTTPLRSIPPLIQPQWFEPFPWLMCPSRYNTSERFNLFHPMSNETYVINIPELVGAVIRCSNFGWLLMSGNNCSLFFFNPFTRAIINLPDLDHKVYFVGMCFTKPPTFADCKIFGLQQSMHSSLPSPYHRACVVENTVSILFTNCTSVAMDVRVGVVRDKRYKTQWTRGTMNFSTL